MNDSLDLAALYEEHHAYIRRTISCWLPRECQSDIWDVAQEVWLSAHQHLHQCRANPKNWLIGIAINEALTHIRKRNTEKRSVKVTCSLSWSMETEEGYVGKELLLGTVPDPRQNAAHLVLEREQRTALIKMHREIAKLPRPMAATIPLILEGYTDDEVGAILGCHAGTVRTNLCRGRQILKKTMRL